MKKNTYIIAVHCNVCRTLLYRYKKEGGGHLLKCYADMIMSDYTKGDLRCPSCGQSLLDMQSSTIAQHIR